MVLPGGLIDLAEPKPGPNKLGVDLYCPLQGRYFRLGVVPLVLLASIVIEPARLGVLTIGQIPDLVLVRSGRGRYRRPKGERTVSSVIVFDGLAERLIFRILRYRNFA